MSKLPPIENVSEMDFEPEKPFIIGVIPHYDDERNIPKVYNSELSKLCDFLFVFYIHVEGYPKKEEEMEEKERKFIEDELRKQKIDFSILTSKASAKDKRAVMQTLYTQVLNLIKNLNDKEDSPKKKTTPIWMLRIDSDEVITKELREELEILMELNYLYTIFFRERHFVSKNEVIIGSGGWTIDGNRDIPRMVKVWDGKDYIIPVVPHHHSTIYAFIPLINRTIPFSELTHITTDEIMIHYGHSKPKKLMRKKQKFYRKRGDMLNEKDDNYIPIDHKHEPRLRKWFKQHDFEGIMSLINDQNI
jgi:hypothetical protein